MSIFKHIAHPAFDKVPGEEKAKSYINPKTGKREYFLGALLAGLGTAARLAVPAIRTAATVGARAAGTALRAGSKFAGTAGKALSQNSGMISKNLGQAAKVGSQYAGQAAKVGAKYAGQAGKYVAKNTLPALKSAGTQIAKAAPDVLAGYSNFQQQRDMRNQQNKMLDIMASMSQPQYQGGGQQQQYEEQPQQAQQQESPVPQYDMPMPQYEQPQYQPQYETQYQPQYQQEQSQNPYGAQPMDYQVPMSYYADGGRAVRPHKKHMSQVAAATLKAGPQPTFDPSSFLDPTALVTELMKRGPAGEAMQRLQEDSGMVNGMHLAASAITGRDGYTKKNANKFFNNNPFATKEDFVKSIDDKRQAGQNASRASFDANRQADIQAYKTAHQYQQPQQIQQQPRQLVADDVVHKRISGVLNRSPDIINKMQQESQGYY